MAKRKRAYIPLTERLAAALACLLPAEVRDDLRCRKVSAKAVIAMFETDHIILHSQGGTDAWYNIDPKQKAEHRDKSRRDTSIVAKGKRLSAEHEEFRRRLLARDNAMAVVAEATRRCRWPKRPFPKRVKA